jgi:hypothetical protein
LLAGTIGNSGFMATHYNAAAPDKVESRLYIFAITGLLLNVIRRSPLTLGTS